MGKLRFAVAGALGRMAARRINALLSGRVPDVELKALVDVPDQVAVEAVDEDDGTVLELKVADQTIFHDKNRASMITLPIVAAPLR